MAKIINPSKLLPSAKSTAITRVGKSNILTKTSSLSKGLLATRQAKDATDANNKLVKVDKFLKSDLIVSQKKAEVQRKDKEKEDFAEAEKKLELPKFKGIKLPGISLPSLGFLDRVKRFIFFTALGWALPKILEFLPKLEGFAKIISGVYQFAEGLFGKLFDGFMSLVKFGGDLKDKTLGFIATAKAGVGGDYQTEFNKLEKQFNTFVNASIIAGVLAADIGSAAVDEYNKQRKKSQKPEPGKPAAKAGAKVTTGRGGEKPKGKPKVTEGKGGKVPGWWNRIFKGPFAKLKGPLSRFAGAAVPGLGAVVGAADAAARFKAGDKIGGALASVSAGLDTITTVLALTGVGLPAAAIFGGVSIGIDVILLIRDIAKAFFPFIPMFSRGGRIVRKYQGGGTARGGRPAGAPKRTISQSKKKPPRVAIPKTQPGKDVGGERKIKQFYAKPQEVDENLVRSPGPLFSPLVNLISTNQTEKVDLTVFETLKKMSGQLKNENTLARGVLGVISSGIDMALGQKPDRRVFESLFSSIGYVADVLANQRMSKGMSSLMSEIKGFAAGGYVPPSRELRETYGLLNTGDLISKLIGPTINQRVNEAIRSIEKELQKIQQKKEEQPIENLDTSPGNIRVTSDSPDFWLLVTAALFENGKPEDGYQGAADVAQAIYNRVSLPGWPKSIRDVILQPGQFSPVDGYGGVREWSKINSKESAIAFAKKYKGYTGNIVERIAATLLDSSKQQKAREFVGPRDNFRSYASEASNNHLSDETEARRHGHVFGFEPRGRNIGAFKKGQLMPAQINRQIVAGKVEELMDMDSGKHTFARSERGSKLAGDLGDFMKKWGGVPGSIWQHSRHGGQGRRSYPSYHNVDRAIDLGAYASEQRPILRKIEEFNRLMGVKPVQILHAGNDPTGKHDDHVHVAYQGGGLVSPSKPNRPIPNSFASYETYGSGMMIAIQPMIIEKQVPVSSGNKMIAFPIPVAVNSSMDNLSFSRG